MTERDLVKKTLYYIETGDEDFAEEVCEEVSFKSEFSDVEAYCYGILSGCFENEEELQEAKADLENYLIFK